MSDTYRIEGTNVMHETIDGEVVIVNLDNGTYYSAGGVGAGVWAQLVAGRTLEALIADAASRYQGDRDQIAAGIEAFVRQLQEEKLIAAVPGPDEPPSPSVASEPPSTAYSDPVLQKYTDMEQLLLVDPIHEVEDSGWPNVK